MAMHALLVEVRFLTDRYHGTVDWPPSPFRLFQALVAGAYGGRWSSEPRETKDAAFEWLERLDAPHVGAPRKASGRITTYYVPNNDLDALGGDPRRTADIRVAKNVAPLLVAGDVPVLYAWPFDDGVDHGRTMCRLAERLHTLGRGVDAAFAQAEIVDWQQAEDRLLLHGGPVHRPSAQRGRPDDPTRPVAGSLQSLDARFMGESQRFATAGRETQFRRAPKAHFSTVAYDAPSARLVFELRSANGEFRSVQQGLGAVLVAMVRAQVAERLARALPARSGEIRLALEGGSSAAVDRERRVRFVPLPSIGHVHTSPSIRRLLVEIPADCPIARRDISWSLSGRPLPAWAHFDEETGEVFETQLVPSEDGGMVDHYGIDFEARRWRTVTPMVLRLERPRGKLSGRTRAGLEAAAAQHVAAVARDAGLPTSGLIVHTQREPFHAKGLRADRFQRGRCADRVLLHTELIFAVPVKGPVLLGDGEYEGLGLFRPYDPPGRKAGAGGVGRYNTSSVVARMAEVGVTARRSEAVARFVVYGGPSIASAIRIAEVMRLALMSALGDHCPSEISGRAEHGPLRAEGAHEHAFYLAEDADGDGVVDHLLIYCRLGFQSAVRRAMDRLSTLWVNAGRGQAAEQWGISLEMICPPADLKGSRLLGFAREWVSVTPYMKPRYDRRPPRDFDAWVATYRQQIEREWRQQYPETPIPTVEALHRSGQFVGPSDRNLEPREFVRTRAGRGGHQPDTQGGFFRLSFPRPTAGPLSIGKHAHFGMGLFERL
jgi:CRISPR-associated protein Csb2